MKTTLMILFYFLSIVITGQVKPSITYDPTTGNYFIEYESEEEDTLVSLVYEPTTKINPSIHVNITNISDSNYYKYSYIVYNSVSSKQRIDEFDIEFFSSIFGISSPNNFWNPGYYSFVPVFGWFDSKGSSGLASPLDGIAVDSLTSGFSFSSFGLPAVVHSYFIGNSTILLAFPDDPPEEIETMLKPLEKFPNNSVIKKTIGPKDPPDPFIPNDFLDTLTNYTDSSYSIGWIKDEQTRDKYDNYFTTAKTYLEQGDSSTARVELQNVLTDCNTDSSTVLTREAYALLYFNTEYLVNKLPEAPAAEGLPVKLEDSQGSLLQGGSLQYYDGGWKDATDNGDGTFTVQTEKTYRKLKNGLCRRFATSG